jgi:formylglycine-generating enzyme required for sulfatase activity
MKPHISLVLAFPVLLAAQENRSLGAETFTNSLGINMVRIDPGSFIMGSDQGDWDERPAHEVTISRPFLVGMTEVTNAQYEQFDPQHKQLRGKLGLSRDDDEAVVFVSWEDAAAFCDWLSRKEGKPYRLPTEAEWEYACRAGTTTAYHMGEALPDSFHKNVALSWFPGRRSDKDIVPVHVKKTPPNAWGLHDMHGNVEEWCLDWYGPYAADEKADPVGRAAGDFRVTRGGSHSTTLEFLRSANRSGTLPEDKSWLIGFRVVQAEMPSTEPLLAPAGPLNARNVSQDIPSDLAEGPDPTKPYFAGPLQYVTQPPAVACPVFNRHNHCPALVNCANGDLLAIWYTCNTEPGRELGIVASRLSYGEDEWQVASNFWDAPDRNDHASALWVDEKGTLYHFNGLSAAATWGSLATIMRTSTDNGATWSKARLIMPEHGLHHMPIESVIRTREGALLVPCDAVPGGAGGSAVLVSRDDGKTWIDPGEGRPAPDFSAGSTGAWIAGIHAGFVQLLDGRLLAFGRGNNIDGRMPMSVSADLGETWTYSAGPFPPISGGQRLAILRLREGPVLFCSFGREVRFRDEAGAERVGSGLFAALSTDEGQSWEIKRLITDDGQPRTVDGGGNTGRFTMSATSAEPRGYLSICQAANGVIHLISSKQYYAFNLAWINTPPPVPPPPAELDAKTELQATYRPANLPSMDGWRYNGTGAVESEAVEVLPGGGIRIKNGRNQRVRWVGDTKETFAARADTAHTAEITMRVTRSTSNSRGVDFETYVPGIGRAFITVTTSSVFWHGGGLDQIAEKLDNASAPHTYRLALGANGLVQIFRDEKRLAVRSAAGGPDPLARAQGAYIQWGEGAGATEADAEITRLAYDTTGAYRPGP